MQIFSHLEVNLGICRKNFFCEKINYVSAKLINNNDLMWKRTHIQTRQWNKAYLIMQ